MYTVSTLLIPYIAPKWVEHRVTMILGLFILAFFNLFVGPFFMEMNLTSMLVGLAVTGFSMGFLTIPNMPEMMTATVEAHPMSDLDHANSLLSGMLNAGFGSGQALGPILGALFYQLTNWRMTMNIISVIVAVHAVLYIITAKGCEAFSRTCKNYAERSLPDEEKTHSLVQDSFRHLVKVRHTAMFKATILSQSYHDAGQWLKLSQMSMS